MFEAAPGAFRAGEWIRVRLPLDAVRLYVTGL